MMKVERGVAMKGMKCFLCLVVFFICFSVPAYTYAKVDLTYVRENDRVFSMEVDDEGDAFVYTTMSFEERSFSHKYSLNDHLSVIYSDIIVLDYFGTDPIPVWRLWFHYTAQDFLGITSITITMDDIEYTFTGVGGKKKMESGDSYVTETPNIVFGRNNLEFWSTFMRKVTRLEDRSAVFNMSLPVVLHGTEDVEIEINGAALADLFMMGEVLIKIADVESVVQIEGTPMKMVNLKTPHIVR